MGRDELLVAIERVRLRGLLPVPVLGQLLDALLGRYAVFAVRMLAQEILVGLRRIGRLGRLPVITHVAAPGDAKRDGNQQRQQYNMRLAHPFLRDQLGYCNSMTAPPRRRLLDRLGSTP